MGSGVSGGGGRAARASALALALAAQAGWSSAQPAWPPGLDAAFAERSLSELAAQGFARPGFVDLSARPPKAPAWVLAQAEGSPGAALFSVVKGHGAAAECWVALRPQSAPGSPEWMLAGAGAASGSTESAMWRAMLRHELGHCALARLAGPGGPPDLFRAEPFADVFALDWSERSEPGSSALGESFARARSMVSGGPRATSAEIRRWLRAPRPASPCQAAWTAAPLDARAPSQACPAPGR